MSSASVRFLVVLAAARAAAGASPPRREADGGGPPLRGGAAAPRGVRGTISAVQVHAVPVTVHKKEAGNGYLPGSPLYEKQQEAKRGFTEPTVADAGVHLPGDAAPLAHAHGVPKDSHGWFYWFVRWIIQFMVFFLPTLIFAIVYRKFRQPPPFESMKETTGTWKYGLFGCFENFEKDWPLCLMASCCPAVRWADTVSNEVNFKMLDFYPALLIMCLFGIFLAPVTASISALLMTCYCVHLRKKLREIYGIEGTMITDFFSWCCCPCCTILQEARQVEGVRSTVIGSQQFMQRAAMKKP